MASTVSLYKPYKRLFKGPADIDAVFDSYDAALSYAQSNQSYDGNIISVISESVTSVYLVNKGALNRVSLDIKSSNSDSTINTNIIKSDEGLTIDNKVNISNHPNNTLTKLDDGLFVARSEGPDKNSLTKYTNTLGNGISNILTVNHNLNTTDITVSMWTTKQPSEFVVCDIVILDSNNIQVLFDEVPIVDAYKIVIIG